ncbi:MAG TPA: FAD-dependent thymidylate synthase [Candidatus Dependentiae bacterium]|nr:FAD-dependent thymidylate synthase [Candidatus Dependentiae bacterium]
MILVKPSYKIEGIYGDAEVIEKAGRVCYKTEDKMTHESSDKFLRKIIGSGHHSVLEHSAMSVRFICDRGVTHELVRHRLCAFSQESTRYCNYKGGVTFVIPPWVNIEPGEYTSRPISGVHPNTAFWYWAMIDAELKYIQLLSDRDTQPHWSPQQARSVLPNSTKTEIVTTANFREWRHIFTLRCAKAAHPQMRELIIPLLEECKKLLPVIFEDITYEK